MQYRKCVWVVAALGAAVLAADSAQAAAKGDGRKQVTVAGVLNTPDDSYVVVLRTRESPARYLPIWIGEMEALAIQLRLEKQEPPRPLTLNLLESVLDSGDIQVVAIAIDDLKGGVFIGSVRLKRTSAKTGKTRSWKVDARPSDAIGLAVSSKAPIWVSKTVLEDAALHPDDLFRDKPDKHSDRPGNVNYEETL